MSNKKPMIIQVLKPEAMIKITVSASFYERLQNLLAYHYTHAKSEEEALKKVVELVKRDPVDAWEYNTVTIAGLIYQIEKDAFEQGMTENKEVFPPESMPDI